MNYIKQDSYVRGLVDRVKDTARIGTMLLIGIGAPIVGGYFANTAHAQEAPAPKETLVDRIKKYQTEINQYRVQGEEEQAEETRKKLEKDIFQAKNLEEALKILDLTNTIVSKDALIKYTDKLDEYLSTVKDKKFTDSVKSAYFSLLAAKNKPNTPKKDKIEIMLKGLVYLHALNPYGDDLDKKQNKKDIEYLTNSIKTVYETLSPEDQKHIRTVAKNRGLEKVLPEEKAKPEKPPKPKKEKPPTEGPPDDPPKPADPVKDPSKVPPAPVDPVIATPPKVTARKIEPIKKHKSFLDAGFEHNTNRSTRGNKHHASLITEFLQGTGLRTDNIWKTEQGSMFNEMRTAAKASANPLAITKVAEILGIDVSDDLAKAIEIGASFDLTELRERYFTADPDTPPPNPNYTSVKESNNRMLTKNSFASVSAQLKFGLGIVGLDGSLIARATAFYEDETSNNTHDSITYNNHLTNPLISYTTADSGDLESRIFTRGIQAELKYESDKQKPIANTTFRFKYTLGAFADFRQIDIIFNNGSKERLEDTFVGVTAKGMVSKHLAYNALLAQEVLAAPGDDDDGWKDIRAHVSMILRPGDYKLTLKDSKTGVEKGLGKIASAVFWNVWLGEGNQPGTGGGAIIGNANLNTEHLNNMVDTIGRTQMGLNREALAEFEQDRLFRTLPLTLGKGIYTWVYGGAFRTRNIEGEPVVGAFGYAGMNLDLLALDAFYRDDHIKRRIGGRLHTQLGRLRFLLGFYDELDLTKKHRSKTGLIGIQTDL